MDARCSHEPMDPEETIEAVPSEENGNVPVDAPSEPIETDAPAEPVETVETPAAEPELYELPDGRKVSGEEVAQEYKNLLSDYTRKSQELAERSRETITEPKPASPYADPNYIPQTYEEIIQAAKKAALDELSQREQERIDAQKSVEDAVLAQLTELKGADPQLNENQLFQHATKYGFRDLKAAYQNMRDMSEMAKKVQQTTATNIAKRQDPVSVSPGATGTRPDPSSFASAAEYLRAVSK